MTANAATSPPPPAIDVRDLKKVFDTVTAVDDVSFTVQPGTITGLLGGNGAGKTTTLSILVGLLMPTAGTVRILDVDVLRDRYGVLPVMNFSSPYVDLPHRLTVWDNLWVYGNLYGVADLRAEIRRLAEDLEFAAFLKRPFGELSAGQKTRVALAKGLINRPRVLLMDEPTASLDPDMADYVRGYLQGYQRETGATMLLASHNMQEVERICHDVVMMRAGRVVDQGSPADLLARYGRTTMEEVFLDIARQRRAANGAAEAARESAAS